VTLLGSERRRADIADGSLLAQDFKTGQLTAGAAGPQGAKGDQGLKGATGPKGDAAAKGDQGIPGPCVDPRRSRVRHPPQRVTDLQEAEQSVEGQSRAARSGQCPYDGDIVGLWRPRAGGQYQARKEAILERDETLPPARTACCLPSFRTFSSYATIWP
jgi:hypothetical protein